MLDQATSQLPPGKNRRHRVAGFIATPADPVTDDMQTALDEQQALIETRTRQLVREAQDAGTAWISRLSTPSEHAMAKQQWLAHTAAIALYRYRYDITGLAPLGDPKDIKTAEQAAEYRVAQAALRSAQAISVSADGTTPRRDTQRVDQSRRL